jgi:hypothetical protein
MEGIKTSISGAVWYGQVPFTQDFHETRRIAPWRHVNEPFWIGGGDQAKRGFLNKRAAYLVEAICDLTQTLPQWRSRCGPNLIDRRNDTAEAGKSLRHKSPNRVP